jgi:hypothetical protein
LRPGGQAPVRRLSALPRHEPSFAGCTREAARVRWLASPGTLRPGGRRSPSGRAGLASRPPIASRRICPPTFGLSEAVGAVLEEERGELVSGGRARRSRASAPSPRARCEFSERLQRRPPLTGFDAADVRIGDARLAEVPLREAELSPPLPDAVTDRAWARRAPGQNGRELTLLLLLFACGVSRKPGCCCRFVECQSLA